MDELNDLKFIKQLRDGDQQAYKVLFDRMIPKLCAFISKFGINRQDAEELSVDTMLKVHKAVRTFSSRDGAKLTTWIFQMAQNKAIDYLRRPPHTELIPLHSDEALNKKQTLPRELTTSINDGSGSVDASFNVLLLRRALDSLASEDQDVLRMRQVMSYEEISQVQNTTVGALRTRYSRAVERLREAFEREKNK